MIGGRDLGTYYVRVELTDGRGWIQRWDTANRFSRGSGNVHPLDAQIIAAGWDSDAGVIHTIHYMYTEGNYSCDCNKSLFLAQSLQQDDVDVDCGDTMEIKEITVLRPDLSQEIIYEKGKP